MSVPNENRIVREYLVTAGTTLYTLTGDGARIYWPYLADDVSETHNVVAMNTMAGGGALADGLIRDVDIEFWLYGVDGSGNHTAADSWTLYAALVDCLTDASGQWVTHEATTSGFIIACGEGSTGVLEMDPRKEWPGIQTIWNFQIRNKT